MNRLILFFVLFINPIFAQKHYVFEVQNIHSYPEAKPVISLIRMAWNQENPKLFFPVFDAEHARFVADSDMSLSEDTLRNLLASEGYILLSFHSSEIIQPKNEEQ